jgi:hypothetical protein
MSKKTEVLAATVGEVVKFAISDKGDYPMGKVVRFSVRPIEGSSRGFFSVLAFLLLVIPLVAQQASSVRPYLGPVLGWGDRHVHPINDGSVGDRAAAKPDPQSQAWLGRPVHGDTLRALHADSDDWDPGFDGAGNRRHGRHKHPRPSRNVNSRVDWAVSLGALSGMGAGQSPAKYSFDVTASPDCANDFVVFTINAPALAGVQANIIALNNLYAGTSPTGLCGTTPTFLWAYAAGVGAASSSPVLSLDGKKVAFIERSAIARAEFHVLTWVAGQGTDATTGSVAPGTGGSSDVTVDYTSLTNAGCTAAPSTLGQSSPYIDYDNDAAFVTADNGRLYRIKDVFQGTPTLDYCVTVNDNTALTSPVYDSGSKTVFLSDGESVYAYAVGATGFSLTASRQVTSVAGAIQSAPIVDSTNGFLYVLAGADSTAVNAVVAQLPLSLASVVEAAMGQAATPNPQADFDDQYFTNGPAAGTMYACGSLSSDNTIPALYSITFAANGVMNAMPAMADDSNLDPGGVPGSCTGIMDFSDGTNDRLFVSASGANAVTMWNVNNRITSSTTTPAATATPYLGGTSGFVIDNISNQSQAASIYFGTLATGLTATCGSLQYCAVKLTQGALR